MLLLQLSRSDGKPVRTIPPTSKILLLTLSESAFYGIVLQLRV